MCSGPRRQDTAGDVVVCRVVEPDTMNSWKRLKAPPVKTMSHSSSCYSANICNAMGHHSTPIDPGVRAQNALAGLYGRRGCDAKTRVKCLCAVLGKGFQTKLRRGREIRRTRDISSVTRSVGGAPGGVSAPWMTV